MAILGFIVSLLVGGACCARGLLLNWFCKALTNTFWGNRWDERIYIAGHWLLGLLILYWAFTNAPFAISVVAN